MIAGGLAAARLVPAPLVVVPLVATSLARRLAVVPVRAEIDGDGLWLGVKLAVARTDVRDAWFDAEDPEIRVHVASSAGRLVVVHLANVDQAERFVRAILPQDRGHRVAGIRPDAAHVLLALRFLAVAIAFAATSGSPASALIGVFFLTTGWAVARAAQLDAGDDAIETKSLRGTRRIPYAEITEIDLEACTVRLGDGELLTLPASMVRTPLLDTNTSTRRAHARVLAHARTRVRDRRAQK